MCAPSMANRPKFLPSQKTRMQINFYKTAPPICSPKIHNNGPKVRRDESIDSSTSSGQGYFWYYDTGPKGSG